jgi:hypothetical protein
MVSPPFCTALTAVSRINYIYFGHRIQQWQSSNASRGRSLIWYQNSRIALPQSPLLPMAIFADD